MFHNLQVIERPTTRPDGALDVIDIWETIQGEGPFTGYPCVFVRLAGCNLQCPHCDTDYTTKRKLFRPDHLIDEIWKLRRSGLVVLTGGEPLRQNLFPFFQELWKGGQWFLQIETNGTFDLGTAGIYYRNPKLTIVCSPKTPKINLKLIPYIHSYKYVVEAGSVCESDGLPTETLGNQYDTPIARPPLGFLPQCIFVSPCDPCRGPVDADKNYEANLQTAVQSCLKFGYRLNLQTHKIIGVK